MHIFISGIGGIGMSSLAYIARDLGHDVSGSDANESSIVTQLRDDGFAVHTPQKYQTIADVHAEHRIDWLLQTKALPEDHPEISFATEVGIKIGERPDFINYLLEETGMKLLSVAGTHGKTNTTALLTWTLQALGEPVSYSVGALLPNAKHGKYEPGAKYFVYETDEFGKQFLHHSPHASIVTSLGYDHPDTYPTENDYKQAFRDFLCQSERSFMWQNDADWLGDLPRTVETITDMQPSFEENPLLGNYIRRNGQLVRTLLHSLLGEDNDKNNTTQNETLDQKISQAMRSYPGSWRRFERLADNIYTDYAHHPAEIAATISLARELEQPVTVVYQPHQNIRQHEIINDYGDCFTEAEQVFWLPTYLSREYDNARVIPPEELVEHQQDKAKITIVNMNDDLRSMIIEAAEAGHTVVLMAAGDLDAWARQQQFA